MGRHQFSPAEREAEARAEQRLIDEHPDEFQQLLVQELAKIEPSDAGQAD